MPETQENRATQSAFPPVGVVLTATETRQYAIHVGRHLLERLGEECKAALLPLGLERAKVLLLSDEQVARYYLPKVELALRSAGFEVTPLLIPPGEESKSLQQAETVYQTLMQAGFTRKDVIIGLGGGVVGDLAGFCAATYHRGMPVIHVPTTLVAQVDSAIGGKTAVNLSRVKNMVGVFHQPLRVISDAMTLETLPARELASGMAEVIKYGLIETSCTGETGLFAWLLQQARANTLPIAFPEMIRRCCHIKAAVVMADELETKGIRFFLNLGHTFGHAYESLSQYGLLHGEAVAIGMLKAVQLSRQLGMLPDDRLEQDLLALYEATHLQPCLSQAARFTPEALLDKMRLDKKNQALRIRVVLPDHEAGRVVVRDDVSDDQILEVLS